MGWWEDINELIGSVLDEFWEYMKIRAQEPPIYIEQPERPDVVGGIPTTYLIIGGLFMFVIIIFVLMKK